MEYFQYQVARFWYRLYWAIMLGLSSSLALLSFGPQLFPTAALSNINFGITDGVQILSIATCLYLILIHWLIARYSLPFATLIGGVLFALAVLQGIPVAYTGSEVYIYIAAWLMTVWVSGAYGVPFLVQTILISMAYGMLTVHFQLAALTTSMLTIVVGSVVVGTLSYLFWKHKFINMQDQKVTQLSGMLRNNQQLSEILIQSIGDGIIVTNTEGKITLINPAAASLTEWPINEATGLNIHSVVKLHKDDGADIVTEENPFTLVLTQQQHISQSVKLVGRNGKQLVISLVVSPVIVPGAKTPIGAVAVMRDISEQRAAEQQRAEFISTASHEMRTPVAAIEGYLSLALNDKVSTIDARARGYLDKAHSSTQHLGKLFQDLLTSSKAEDGRLNNHPTVTEMGAFLQQLTGDLKFTAEKKGLFVDFIIGGANGVIDATAKDVNAQHLLKPLYYAYIDPERIREVVTNLFDNACKYTDAGKISVGLTGDASVIQLYVKDTGAGIPPDDIPHLFQKFYRIDNSATRTIGGTGLGLFISRKIIELYHGRIWVESQIGQGSTFFINIPRLSTKRATELQAGQQSALAPVPPAPVNT